MRNFHQPYSPDNFVGGDSTLQPNNTEVGRNRESQLIQQPVFDNENPKPITNEKDNHLRPADEVSSVRSQLDNSL